MNFLFYILNRKQNKVTGSICLDVKIKKKLDNFLYFVSAHCTGIFAVYNKKRMCVMVWFDKNIFS